MNYTIKNVRVEKEVLWVDVDFNKTLVSVACYQPKDKAEVMTSVANRMKSEKAKLDAEANNKLVEPRVLAEKDKPIPVTAIEE